MKVGSNIEGVVPSVRCSSSMHSMHHSGRGVKHTYLLIGGGLGTVAGPTD